MNPPEVIRSRDNALYKDLRRLLRKGGVHDGRIWVEGEHLCHAALDAGWQPELAALAESAWPHQAPTLQSAGIRQLVLADALMAQLSALPSPARLALVLRQPEAPVLQPQAATIILDRVQDAGNVGSIMRSAAAFGFAQFIALQGCARLWSGKVLRAAMGAHFHLKLFDGAEAGLLSQLQLPLLATSSHDGKLLHLAELPWPCAWLMGHEGQGLSPELQALAHQRLRIAQPGAMESLNVAVAAAICMHASSCTTG